MSEAQFTSGMLVFPNLTQLDLTGPYEVLARLPASILGKRAECGAEGVGVGTKQAFRRRVRSPP